MLHGMKMISQASLTQLCNNGQHSPRKRHHLYVHTELSDPIQHLFVAFEPGTYYVQPHRHPQSGKRKMFVLLVGEALVLLFETESSPYTPLTDKDFASRASKENTPSVTNFMRWFERGQAGETAPILKA